MKIDLKNPIISSLISIGITFVISMTILLLAKPSYIMEISKEGKTRINIYLTVTFSLLFSILIGIIFLILKTDGDKQKTVQMGFSKYNAKAFNPLQYSPK